MGSQTLEILRQGIWASLTGGWFFDPHQEIFCNTFHMYLWLGLLLVPFVLHLITTSATIPTILYPALIFTVFALIKFVNYKLHILFDGEELLEDGKQQDGKQQDGKQQEECKPETIQEQDQGSPKETLEKKYTDVIVTTDDCETNEMDSSELQKPPDLSDGTSLKDEIEEALKKPDNKEFDYVIRFPSPEFPDNILGLVTTIPTLSPVVERAFVVDLQSTKTEFNEKDGNLVDMDASNEISTTTEASSSPAKFPDIDADDNNLIIANKPTVRNELENITVVSADKRNGESRTLPLSSSTESSWGSSSDSSISEDLISPRVQFMPVHPPDTHNNQSENKGACGKSESALSTTKAEIHVKDDDKAVSLPALEVKEKDGKKSGRESRTKQNTHVGFSLPEIEKPAIEELTDVPSTSKSDPDNIMSTEEGYNASLYSPHSPRIAAKMFSDNDVSTSSNGDKLSALVTRDRLAGTSGSRTAGEIIRTGAIRGSGPFRSSVSRGSYSISRRRQRTNSGSPGTSLLRQESDPVDGSTADSAKHVAMSYEDTSTGAVHCFQDEFGQWYAYTFGEESTLQPISRSFVTDALNTALPSTSHQRDSNTSSLLSQDTEPTTRIPVGGDGLFSHHWGNGLRLYTSPTPAGSILKVTEPTPKKYYMFSIIRNYSVKVSFDRLKLLALLDRNKNKSQSIFSVVLATLVAYLGYVLLSRNFYYDLWMFVVCFVMAKCQFSLLKSVQPDSASPVHGHNNMIVFSRSVYFCITALLIIFIDDAATWNQKDTTLYTIPLHSKSTLLFARDLMLGFLLAFPLIFLFGLLPQVNTFVMHCMEQFDIHIFGGSAMTSLSASVYAFIRAVVCVLFLSVVCMISLKLSGEDGRKGQHVLFSVFSGLLLATSYHMSRSTSSPAILWKILKLCSKREDHKTGEEDTDDPLPDKLLKTVKTRLVHDIIVCVAVAFVVFAVHLSTAFTTLQPAVSYTFYILTGVVGVLTHYLLPQLRKQLPWLFVSTPVLKSYEYNFYEWQEHSRIMWFEKLHVWLAFIEKNILYPVVWLSAVTGHADQVADKFGTIVGAIIITVTSVKFLRSNFTNTPRQHIVLIWTVLFFEFDYRGYSETLLIDYFFMAIFVDKMMELYLKFKFILTYTAPWQITWGSAFHAFAQPFSVPHCGMLIVQTVVSSFFSSPLNPFLGSAIFLTSYMRPIKFWEKDYNTKRVDHSNTRLSSHIDSNPGADDNNLNSIFYEHLTRSLQHSLSGDLSLGRWGNFGSGDCFIMASDYLNALVHIIEVGNGYVTFQLRGLEFRGTYCQQREVEAITENVEDDEGCCCCQPGHVSNLLSFNAAFSQRWLAWEVVQSKYILEGYSVSDNTAVTMFQMFDLRKIFITYYVTSIVFYCVRNEKLLTWLSDEAIMNQLEELKSSSYVDFDTVFRPVTDKDYDLVSGGITRYSFCLSYHDWLVCCNKQRPADQQIEDVSVNSNVVTLCLALSLLGRRLLSTASNNQWNAALKSFLHGLHALFKGDFRVTATKDEWVFTDPDLALLRMVVAPAVRMALKLHQDHFTCVDEFEDNDVLYETISSHEQQFVICHEGHPAWRQAVLNNRSNLLALRYVMDDGTDDYKIIMLNRRCLNFRVIKVNKECVRGLWAGQLQELIFLRNRNPERGSIQNAKQALRNMINSSCDQPIGYPIYVSPLTTSYSESNSFYRKLSMGAVNLKNIRKLFSACYESIVNRYAGHCRGGGRSRSVEIEMSTYVPPNDPTVSNKSNTSKTAAKGLTPVKSINIRNASYTSIPSSSNHSSSMASSHGECSGSTKLTRDLICSFPVLGRAQITNVSYVHAALDNDIYSHLQWPSNMTVLRERSTMNNWDGWVPCEDMIGDILHIWNPSDEENLRIHVNLSVYLLRIEDYIVPVLQDGVHILDEIFEEMKL